MLLDLVVSFPQRVGPPFGEFWFAFTVFASSPTLGERDRKEFFLTLYCEILVDLLEVKCKKAWNAP